MREIQRNIHRKTAKYHLLLALTDSIIFINDFLIMVRTYTWSINHLPRLQCIPETKCQSQGQKEHQTLPGMLSVSTDCHQRYQVGDTVPHCIEQHLMGPSSID